MIIAGNGEVELSANTKPNMSIHICATWPAPASEQEEDDQYHIIEDYHGDPYPSCHLVSEAFETPEPARIPAAVLRARLPETLRLSRERERAVYGVIDEGEIMTAGMNYVQFVEHCETIEKITGEPAVISASR